MPNYVHVYIFDINEKNVIDKHRHLFQNDTTNNFDGITHKRKIFNIDNISTTVSPIIFPPNLAKLRDETLKIIRQYPNRNTLADAVERRRLGNQSGGYTPGSIMPIVMGLVALTFVTAVIPRA